MNEVINNNIPIINPQFNQKEKDLMEYINHQIESSNNTTQQLKKYHTYNHVECKNNDDLITREEIIRYICSKPDTINHRMKYESVVIFKIPRLKNTLRQIKTSGIKIKLSGNKEQLIQRLTDHYNVTQLCDTHRQNLILFRNRIQKYIKNKPIFTWDRYTNIYKKRKLCVNEEDPIGCYEIKEIDNDYFYVIKENKHYYGYDIRTIFGIMFHSGWRNSKNPLTRVNFDKMIYIDCLQKINELKEKNKSIFYEDETVKKKNNPRENLINIINKLSYELYQLDFHVTEEQLRSIMVKEYLNVYCTFSNIWFFNLSNEQRAVYDNNLNQPLNIYTYRDLNQILSNQNNTNDTYYTQLANILTIFYKLITNPNNIEDKKTGAMYIMISLCSINSSIRDEYPQFINVLQPDN